MTTARTSSRPPRRQARLGTRRARAFVVDAAARATNRIEPVSSPRTAGTSASVTTVVPTASRPTEPTEMKRVTTNSTKDRRFVTAAPPS
jgi:hypothetical protein